MEQAQVNGAGNGDRSEAERIQAILTCVERKVKRLKRGLERKVEGSANYHEELARLAKAEQRVRGLQAYHARLMDAREPAKSRGAVADVRDECAYLKTPFGTVYVDWSIPEDGLFVDKREDEEAPLAESPEPGIPADPHWVYADEGWKGYADWLGLNRK